MKRIKSVFKTLITRPNNGTDAFELLRHNKNIEINNSVVYWFIEQLEKHTDFSFCYHLNKHNNNWTTLYKIE